MSINRISDELVQWIESIPNEQWKLSIWKWAIRAEATINESGQYSEDYVLQLADGSSDQWAFVFLGGDDGWYQIFDVWDFSDGELRQDRWDYDQYVSYVHGPSESDMLH